MTGIVPMKSRGTTGTRYTTVEAVSVLYPIVPVSGIMPYCLQSCPILVVRTPCGPSCAVRYSQVSGRVPSNGEVLDPCCVYFFFFHLVVFFVFLRFGSFNFLYLRVVISTLFSFFAIAAFFSFSCPLLFLFLRCFAFSYFFSSFSVVDFFLCFFRFFVLYILISYPTFFFPCVSFSKGFKSNRGGGGSSFFFRKTLHEVLHLLSLHSAVCKNKQRLDFFYLARDSCGMMTCCYVDAPRHKQQVAFFPLEFLSGIEVFFFFRGGGKGRAFYLLVHLAPGILVCFAFMKRKRSSVKCVCQYIRTSSVDGTESKNKHLLVFFTSGVILRVTRVYVRGWK